MSDGCKHLKDKDSKIEHLPSRMSMSTEIIKTDPMRRRMGDYSKKNVAPKDDGMGPLPAGFASSRGM